MSHHQELMLEDSVVILLFGKNIIKTMICTERTEIKQKIHIITLLIKCFIHYKLSLVMSLPNLTHVSFPLMQEKCSNSHDQFQPQADVIFNANFISNRLFTFAAEIYI